MARSFLLPNEARGLSVRSIWLSQVTTESTRLPTDVTRGNIDYAAFFCRARAISSKVSPAPSRSACLPPNCCHRWQMTSA